jgi:paraquat-inducible protein B
MKRHALLVGSFLIGALVLAVAGVLWLSGADLFQQQLRAVVYFQGNVSGLYIGAPVTFRGVQVGQVMDIGIQVDRQTLAASIPVYVRLQPSAVRVNGGKSDLPIDLQQLVQRGLRARLVAQSFVTGQRAIDLDFAEDTPAVLLGQNGEPEIPALPDRFGALIDQVAELPLRQTAEELLLTLKVMRTTLAGVQATLTSVQATLDVSGREVSATAAEARKTLAAAAHAMQQVERNANATLASVTRLSETTRDTVAGVQPELQRALTGAREAAESARLAMDRVSELSAPGAPLREDLETAVRDLSQAARGLRDWAELLEEKPNAVIFGNRP